MEEQYITKITIKRGETLVGLAWKHYQDHSKWREIAEFNNIDPFVGTLVGKEIKIPVIEQPLDLESMDKPWQSFNWITGDVLEPELMEEDPFY